MQRNQETVTNNKRNEFRSECGKKDLLVHCIIGNRISCYGNFYVEKKGPHLLKLRLTNNFLKTTISSISLLLQLFFKNHFFLANCFSLFFILPSMHTTDRFSKVYIKSLENCFKTSSIQKKFSHCFFFSFDLCNFQAEGRLSLNELITYIERIYCSFRLIVSFWRRRKHYITYHKEGY